MYTNNDVLDAMQFAEDPRSIEFSSNATPDTVDMAHTLMLAKQSGEYTEGSLPEARAVLQRAGFKLG